MYCDKYNLGKSLKITRHSTFRGHRSTTVILGICILYSCGQCVYLFLFIIASQICQKKAKKDVPQKRYNKGKEGGKFN